MENRFYVYLYLDQRKEGLWKFSGLTFTFQPFYVGKGTRNRDLSHLCTHMLIKKSLKSSTIKSIINETGEHPLHYRIFNNLNEKDAIRIEKKMIKFFGRRDNNTGILCNMTDGGDGLMNPSSEIISKMGNRRKKIYQYSLNGEFIRMWSGGVEFEMETNNRASNISTAIKRRGTCYGYIWSYEYFETYPITMIKYQMPIKFKNIKQISIQNGTIINVFEDALSAARSLNLSKAGRNRILDCVNGRMKTAYGFKWKI